MSDEIGNNTVPVDSIGTPTGYFTYSSVRQRELVDPHRVVAGGIPHFSPNSDSECWDDIGSDIPPVSKVWFDLVDPMAEFGSIVVVARHHFILRTTEKKWLTSQVRIHPGLQFVETGFFYKDHVVEPPEPFCLVCGNRSRSDLDQQLSGPRLSSGEKPMRRYAIYFTRVHQSELGEYDLFSDPHGILMFSQKAAKGLIELDESLQFDPVFQTVDDY